MRVLLVESEESSATFLAQGMRRVGHKVEIVHFGRNVLDFLHRVDLVILDLDTPDVDGLDICRRIRAVSDIPIISGTGDRTELARVLALGAGSDDCVDRPYGFRELMARVEAVMRRVRVQAMRQEELSHGPLRIDPGTRAVSLADRAIQLTDKEFDLLQTLAARPGTVISREEIMARVWGDIWNKTGRTIDTHVSSLRAKLGRGDCITTVRGVGFRFDLHPALAVN